MSVQTGVFALVALFAACTGADSGKTPAKDGPATTKVDTRDSLVVGWQSDIGQLLSAVYESAADAYILDSISFPMIDSEFECSLKKLPAYAKSWEWTEDGTILRMELRDDIKWEDGVPVTAEDVAFTYELIADPTVASPRLSHIERMKPDGRPKIIDANHIEWHFTQAYDRDTQVSHASLGLVPKHIWKDADRATLRGNPKINQPLSYGAWRLARWEPNQRVVLEPNPTFTGPEFYRPHLNSVIFRILPDYSTRLIELEAGNIDLMEQVLVADADRLRDEHPEIKLQRRGWRSNDYVAWNLANPIFSDVNVRKALAAAVDTEAMIARLLTSKSGESYARPSIGTITPALCGVHNDDVVPIAHSVQKAKQLLAEAGWKDTNGDGVLDKGGKKFEFTLLTNTGNKRRGDAAVLIQDQLKQVGVSVKLDRLETNSFFERLRKRDYEAALAGWSAGLFIDPASLWRCDEPEKNKRQEFNFTGYCNPEVDKLIDQGLATPLPKDSAPIWKDLQAKIYADQPYLFLWWMDEIVAVNSRFENITVDILSPFNRLYEWEVPVDKVKY